MPQLHPQSSFATDPVELPPFRHVCGHGTRSAQVSPLKPRAQEQLQFPEATDPMFSPPCKHTIAHFATVVVLGTEVRVGAGTRVGRGFRVRFAAPVVVFHVALVRVFATTVSLVGLARVERTRVAGDFVLRVGTTVKRVAAGVVRDARWGSVTTGVVRDVRWGSVMVVVAVRVGAATRVGRLV